LTQIIFAAYPSQKAKCPGEGLHIGRASPPAQDWFQFIDIGSHLSKVHGKITAGQGGAVDVGCGFFDPVPKIFKELGRLLHGPRTVGMDGRTERRPGSEGNGQMFRIFFHSSA
jgi:hypothetical protein